MLQGTRAFWVGKAKVGDCVVACPAAQCEQQGVLDANGVFAIISAAAERHPVFSGFASYHFTNDSPVSNLRRTCSKAWHKGTFERPSLHLGDRAHKLAAVCSSKGKQTPGK